jgi:hypothetical protein
MQRSAQQGTSKQRQTQHSFSSPTSSASASPPSLPLPSPHLATLAVLLPLLSVSMFLFSLLSLFLATPAFGQDIVYDQGHNVTSIVGTWASGSQNVVTGSVSPPDTPQHHVVHTHIPDRALHNPPTNRSSTHKQPAYRIHCESIRDVGRRKLRRRAYSSSDGFYEIARYRMTGNGDRPSFLLARSLYSLS